MKITKKNSFFPSFHHISLSLLSLFFLSSPWPSTTTIVTADLTTILSTNCFSVFLHNGSSLSTSSSSFSSFSSTGSNNININLHRCNNQQKHHSLHQHDRRTSPPQVVLHPCLASTFHEISIVIAACIIRSACNTNN